MREIKFRAWDKEGNVMCDVITLNRPLGSDWHDMTVNWDGKYYNRQSDKIKLMQYTGLKDKNGNEIYDGDILRDDDFCGEIAYQIDIGAYYVMNNKDGYLLSSMNMSGKVIGNIYENPEILDGDNNDTGRSD